jgi:hypothetical protein
MSYTLNTVNITTYGITPGHVNGSNIALSGCYSMPSRIGKTFHSWGDSNSIEPYVETGEIMFAGRDIVFIGAIFGTVSVITAYLKLLYTAIEAFSGLVAFATPYGTYSVYVKSVTPKMINGAASIEIIFREPVVTLTGTIPSAANSDYTIDGRPFSSYGLYMSKADALNDLPEMKQQIFTQYGSEGYRISKRQNKTLELNGFIIGSSIADFQSKVSALYKCFSSSGTRNIKINNDINADCFLTEGFTIDNILYNGEVIANFSASLMCYSVNYLSYLLTEASEYILTESDEYILI